MSSRMWDECHTSPARSIVCVGMHTVPHSLCNADSQTDLQFAGSPQQPPGLIGQGGAHTHSNPLWSNQ